MERIGQTMYEAGREFYTEKISEETAKLPEVKNNYDLLQVLDSLELFELKLNQLNRKEKLLKEGGDINGIF